VFLGILPAPRRGGDDEPHGALALRGSHAPGATLPAPGIEGASALPSARRPVHRPQNAGGPRTEPTRPVEAWSVLPRGAGGACSGPDAAVHARGASGDDAPVGARGRAGSTQEHGRVSANPRTGHHPMRRRRGHLINGNPPGDSSTAPRCGARTRGGGACRSPAVRGKRRCRMHGGLSTGPRTPEGLERSRRARWLHGRYSVETRRRRAALIERRMAELWAESAPFAKAEGFIIEPGNSSRRLRGGDRAGLRASDLAPQAGLRPRVDRGGRRPGAGPTDQPTYGWADP
jgi:glucans biosynthesis protein